MAALHNFLRNNFRPGEWIGRICGPIWGNRVANVLQDVQGIGCRWYKPTDQEGRGWRVIFDGSSDVQLPPGWVWPWDTKYKGLFSIHFVAADEFSITGYNKELSGGVYMVGVQKTEIVAGTGLTWADDTWQSGTIEDGTQQAVWLEMDRQTTVVTIMAGSDFPDGTSGKYAYTEIVPLWFFTWDTDRITTIYDMRLTVRLPAMA